VNANKRTENSVFELESEDAETNTEQLAILAEKWPDSVLEQVDREVALAERILVPSEYVRDDLIRRGTDQDRILTLPYGVDTSSFQAVHRDDANRALNVLYVGQVGYRKGLKYLGAAVSLAKAAVKEFEIVGPVVNRSALLSKLPTDFKYIPRASSNELASQYYRNADVFVLPSLADSFGLVVLEAMAASLPVIVTKETGASELIVDGVEGFVVSARDERAIAERLVMLANDGELRRNMGLAARACAEKNSWDLFENRAIALLSSLVGAC